MRILTYNIRHGQGIFSPISLRRTVRVISSVRADIVALNEVYRWPPLADQVARLSQLTGMNASFQHNTSHGPAAYGNLLLTHVPVRLRADLKLPGRGEQRGCLLAECEFGGRTARIALTHLGLTRKARAQQIELLARELPRDVPLVLLGDLNCTAGELGPVLEFLHSAEDEPRTFPSWWPRIAYDHILVSEQLRFAEVAAVPSLASDHLPLYADLDWA